MSGICVFGASSSNIDHKYTEEAFELGALLAENNMELVFGGGAVGLDGVRHGDEAQQTALFGKVQHRLAVIGPPARLRGKGGYIHALFLHIGGVSGIDGSVMEKGLHTAAGHGGEIRHITQGNAPLVGGLRYGAAERMLAGLLHAGRHAQQLLLRDLRRGCKRRGEAGGGGRDGHGHRAAPSF